MKNVLWPQDEIPTYNSSLIDELKERARKADNKRARLCLHRNEQASIHNMLVVLHKQTLIPPHRSNKQNYVSIVVIEGKMLAVMLDDEGGIVRNFVMGPRESNEPFIYRNDLGHWRVHIPLTEFTVLYETLKGPYENKSNEKKPDWIPTGRQELRNYLENLKRQCGEK